MKDRYLFKAKRLDNGEWVKGALVYDNMDKLYRIIIELDYSTGTCIKADKAPRVNASTICQCTGLKDKNGNLIWENDIVCHAYTKYQKENTDYPPFCRVEKRKNYVIKWDNTMVHLGFRYHNGRNIFPFKNGTVINGDDEVIGNVFDNPELLESEEAGR